MTRKLKGTLTLSPAGTPTENNTLFVDTADDTLKFRDNAGTTGAIAGVTVPIGAIVSWLKSLTGTPAVLPVNFVECNGQTISDVESPYDGVTLPDLNGENRFLRGGSTSGATGGAATTANHLHQWGSGVSGTYGIELNPNNITSATRRSLNSSGTWGDFTHSSGVMTGDYYTTNNGTHTNEPQYYQIVMIMRIK